MPIAELPGDAQDVLSVLASDRLITVREGEVEVAHEALLREWPRLRAWLDEDADGRRVHRHLTETARGWDAGGRDAGELYRGSRLVAASERATAHDEDLNALEREFLAASHAASEAEAERRRHANRRLRGLLAGVATMLVLAAVAGAIALSQRGQARDAALTADAQRLGADAHQRADRPGPAACALRRRSGRLDRHAQQPARAARARAGLARRTARRRLALAVHCSIPDCDADGRAKTFVDLIDPRAGERRQYIPLPPLPNRPGWEYARVHFQPNGRDLIVQQTDIAFPDGPASRTWRLDAARGTVAGPPLELGSHAAFNSSRPPTAGGPSSPVRATTPPGRSTRRRCACCARTPWAAMRARSARTVAGSRSAPRTGACACSTSRRRRPPVPRPARGRRHASPDLRRRPEHARRVGRQRRDRRLGRRARRDPRAPPRARRRRLRPRRLERRPHPLQHRSGRANADLGPRGQPPARPALRRRSAADPRRPVAERRGAEPGRADARRHAGRRDGRTARLAARSPYSAGCASSATPRSGVASSPDGRLLAANGFEDPVEVRDTRTGRVVARLDTGANGRSVAFSPNGELLAIGRYGGSARLVSTDTWKPVGRAMDGQEARLTALEFHLTGACS